MKHLLSLSCFFLSSFFSLNADAQTKLAGAWEGKLEAAGNLRLVLNLAPAAGDSLKATMDSPDQGAMGIAATAAYKRNDSVFVFWAPMQAAFKAAIQDTALVGIWQQRGASLPLLLHKTDKPAALHRPQTPQPPFPYQSTDLTFKGKENGITYGATLTLPNGKGPFPALLLLTGSGPQNRDEALFGHKPFAVLADFLTRRGYAVLRVDDRGVGQTTGNVADATQKHLLEDATAAFEFLKSRPEVNIEKLGILGHSEGGMIAEIMGAERADIAFLILMAAPGTPGTEMLREQNEMLLRSLGRSKEDAELYGSFYRQLIHAVLQSKDSAEASRRLQPIVGDWVKQTDKKVAFATAGIQDSLSKARFVASFAALAQDTPLLDIVRYEPAPYLKKIKAKVLALNGSLDIQVISASNLAGMDMALAQGLSKGYEVKELPGLNHLFQKCTKCTVQEYGQLEETLNPALLEAIGEWLEREVRK